MKQLKKSTIYKDTYQGYLNKEPFNSTCVYSIFSFSCPLFLFEVTRRYEFGNYNPIAEIPDPTDISHALLDFFASGDPILINNFYNVRFWYKGQCYGYAPEDHVFVTVVGDYHPFLDKCLNFYRKFYDIYKSLNYNVI